MIRTLNIRHALIKNLLQHPRVLQLLLHLRNDRLCQFSLLPFLQLPFIPYPRVKRILRLGRERRLLLKLVRLSLELRSLLYHHISPQPYPTLFKSLMTRTFDTANKSFVICTTSPTPFTESIRPCTALL